MKISTLIRGLSIATVLLVAGSPAYGASIFINAPLTQLDDDPILEIAGRPGDTISWEGFIDTSGLPANLQSATVAAVRNLDEIADFEDVLNPANASFFPTETLEDSFDTSENLATRTGFLTGPPGLPPNNTLKIVDVSITLGNQINNDGRADYRISVLSAIDTNGTDITALFGSEFQEFEVQPVPVPEPLSVFGLVLAGGFGIFLKKKNREVL